MGAVLKAFPFAADGYTVEWLAPGDERNFGALESALVEAGVVASQGADAPGVSVPVTAGTEPSNEVPTTPVRGRAKRS